MGALCNRAPIITGFAGLLIAQNGYRGNGKVQATYQTVRVTFITPAIVCNAETSYNIFFSQIFQEVSTGRLH